MIGLPSSKLRVRAAIAAALIFGIAFGIAVSQYIQRNSREIIPDIPPSAFGAPSRPLSPGGRLVASSEIASRMGIEVAKPDPNLRTLLLPVAQATCAVFANADVDVMEDWRESFGMPPRDKEELRHTVEVKARRFASLTLHWDRAEFFPSQVGKKRYAFPRDGFQMVMYDMTSLQSGHPERGKFVVPDEGRIVTCKITCTFPEDYSEAKEGFVMLHMTDAIPQKTWATFRVAIATREEITDGTEFLPAIK